MVDTARSHDVTLLPDAINISQKFKEAFTHFSRCHNLYDGTVTFTQREVDELGMCNIKLHVSIIIIILTLCAIKLFVAYYRATFPKATFLPKLHMMEDHVVAWIKKWNVGCGIMGEQGAESLHASFNYTERAYNNMRDRVARMKVLLKNHIVQVLPANKELQPPLLKKRRKKTRVADEDEEPTE